MCAINGFTFKDEALIEQMNTTTAHRGPDGTGIFTDPNISLGHNRLSIIDTSSAGNQPMKSTDGKLVITYNGELYNFKELRKELKDSYNFVSQSDTEVILAAYKKWGTKAFSKFNGIFAFALWDRDTEELILVRDSVGIKPLYYFWDSKKLIFSSEMKAILEHPIPRALNQEAFQYYFHLLYVPEPLTMISGISKISPGHFGRYVKDDFNIEKYTSTHPPVDRGISYDIWKTELVSSVTRAVSEQLMSDRPLGVYLSGGFDSSAVLHSMSGIMGRDITNTFSVGFSLTSEEESEKFNADFHIAKQVSNFFDTQHHEYIVEPNEVTSLFEKSVWHMDQPIANPTAIAMYALSKYSKGTIDVALGGDGGDELFGGYRRYQLSSAASNYQRLPAFIRIPLNAVQRLRKLNTPAGTKRFLLFHEQKDEAIKEFLAHEKSFSLNDFFEKRFGKTLAAPDFERSFMQVDMQSWLPDQSLSLTDTMGMAHGLEVRTPILSTPLIKFSQRIPTEYKVTPFRTKRLLKDAYRGKLPDILYNQPKRGWMAPGAKWLRHDTIKPFAKEILSQSYYSATEGLFHWPQVSKMWVAHETKQKYHAQALWALLTFQVWARLYSIEL